MTAHVLSPTFVRQKFCLDCGPITAAHTADNIRSQFEKVVAAWPGVKNKIFCVVRDGASSVKKVSVLLNELFSFNRSYLFQAFEDGEYTSVWCSAHLLNLCVKDAIDTQQHLANAISDVRSVAKLFNKSPSAKLALEKAQTNDGKQPLMIVCVS